MTATAFDPRDPAYIRNPFPTLARLREADPVLWSPNIGGWVVTRYDDCKLVLTDPRFSAARMRPFFAHLPPERRAQVKELEWSVGLWAVFQDQPDHTRLRRLLNRGFTSRAVERMVPRIHAIVDELLDAVAERGEMEAVADFAYPLPATVIMEMLGAPREGLDEIKRWSDDVALFVGGALVTREKYERAEEGTKRLSGYFRTLVRERRARPQDDMLSALIAAQDEGDMLGEEELIATCILLLFAGHETTANLIGSGLYHLTRNPEQASRLLARPELAEGAVEEILRYDGPTGAMVRIADRDLELRGRPIRKGERIFAMLNSACRDPEQFDDPDRFDVAREQNRQISFGHGIHFCLGAPLARLEGRIALPRALQRLRGLEVVDDAGLEWSDSLILRGIKRLPLRFRARS